MGKFHLHLKISKLKMPECCSVQNPCIMKQNSTPFWRGGIWSTDKKNITICRYQFVPAKTERVFAIAIHDIDLSVLPEFHLTYDTYFLEADKLAKFIYEAKSDALNIICQCEYGESRSSGCAAAILEHFYQNGISIQQDNGDWICLSQGRLKHFSFSYNSVTCLSWYCHPDLVW